MLLALGVELGALHLLRPLENRLLDGFVRAQAERTRSRFLAERLAPETAGRFARLAEESVQAQQRQEAGDSVPFEEFLRGYLAAERLVPQAKAA